jgi:hypothetical protein
VAECHDAGKSEGFAVTGPISGAPCPDPVEEVRFGSAVYRLFGKLRVRDPTTPTILLLHGLGFLSLNTTPWRRALRKCLSILWRLTSGVMAGAMVHEAAGLYRIWSPTPTTESNFFRGG